MFHYLFFENKMSARELVTKMHWKKTQSHAFSLSSNQASGTQSKIIIIITTTTTTTTTAAAAAAAAVVVIVVKKKMEPGYRGSSLIAHVFNFNNGLRACVESKIML